MPRLLSRHDARICLAGQGFSIIGDSALWLAGRRPDRRERAATGG
jgi:hypothetical protein